MLFLPAPPRYKALPAPVLSPGDLVQFSALGLAGMPGTHQWQHWALRHGNKPGRVRKVHYWSSRCITVQVDFPHRLECWLLKDLEKVTCNNS